VALLDILHEDDELLVVDKPAGLVCHPSKAGPESSLIGRIRLHLGDDRGRLVNRLDRETGGIVVVAKGRDAAREAGRLFSEGTVEKTYTGVVEGALEQALDIDAPLGKDDRSAVVIKDAVRADGAAAQTSVRPLGFVAGPFGPLTVVEARPRTGRKHQIRAHLAFVGHPIVGDKIYGGDETRYLRFVVGALTDVDRAALILECHALHASRLSFVWRQARHTWTSMPPAGMAALIAGMVPESVSAIASQPY
jgi:23S rRNA pseudouridine1911/1915/1917 synthase